MLPRKSISFCSPLLPNSLVGSCIPFCRVIDKYLVYPINRGVHIYVARCKESSSAVVAENSLKEVRILPKRNATIPRMDPSEFENSPIGVPLLPLAARRGEPVSIARYLRLKKDDPPGKLTDDLAKWQNPLDISPSAFKFIYSSIKAEEDIKRQCYNAERVRVLGRDLGAAHFILARKGKVRFMGQSEWIAEYNDDTDDDRDLPITSQSYCKLPVAYDPNYRLEGLDASAINIRYEGLSNLRGLNYLKWLNLRNNVFLNDWCLDRTFCHLSDTLEHLDVSGCRHVTAAGLSAIVRLKKLKTLVVENMDHVKDLELLCCRLEEEIPGLICVGIDYENKILEMRKEAEDMEKRRKEEEEVLERNTLEIIPRISCTSPLEKNSKNHNSNDFQDKTKQANPLN